MKSESPRSLTESPADPVLQAYLLGTVEFEAALALQRRLVYQIAGEPGSTALILCEHEPLITVGRQGSHKYIQIDPEELEARGWRVRWVNRGGGCLLHVPGQLAVCSIVALDRLEIGLQGYLERLHQVLVALLDDFRVRGELRPGFPGVWVNDRLIAGVGIAVRSWVTYYGAYVNINPDLRLFRGIRSGRRTDGPMTSLERERRGSVRAALVRERLLEHFAASFPVARTSLFSDHPSLSRKASADAIPARS